MLIWRAAEDLPAYPACAQYMQAALFVRAVWKPLKHREKVQSGPPKATLVSETIEDNVRAKAGGALLRNDDLLILPLRRRVAQTC